MKVWKEIPGWEGYYEISSLGFIRGVKRKIRTGNTERYAYQKLLSTRLNNWGYWEVRLSKDGITTTQFVHRLLALTYISNPLGKQFVNHVNGNKADNRLENLEWVTHSENIQHAFDNNLIANRGKKVIDNCTGKIFADTKEASLFSGIKRSTLRGYLNGSIKKNPTCMEYQVA